MMKQWAEFQRTLSNNTVDFLCSQYFNIKPTLLSNHLAVRRRRLDLFHELGGALHIVFLSSIFDGTDLKNANTFNNENSCSSVTNRFQFFMPLPPTDVTEALCSQVVQLWLRASVHLWVRLSIWVCVLLAQNSGKRWRILTKTYTNILYHGQMNWSCFQGHGVKVKVATRSNIWVS